MADEVEIEDALAEVLATCTVRGAVSACMQLAAPWAMRFPAASRACFHIVTHGGCYLRVEGDEPVPLTSGDVVLLPHGSDHILSSIPRSTAPTFTSATRAKNTYLRAQFHRIRARRGPKKAIMAVAASILTAAYIMLRDGAEYRDLGHDYFDNLDKSKTTSRLVRRLQDLGYEVELKSAA